MDFVSDRIRKLSPYTSGEQTEYIIKLNTNENPYPPSPRINELLKSIEISNLKRYPNQTSERLRNALATKYKVKPDMIFVGNGSDEILALLHFAFFDDIKENIAYPDVTYSLYLVYDDLFKNKTYNPPLNDDFTLDLTNYEDLDVKGYIFANPNAPTSIAIPATVIEDFIIKHRDKLVIIDEAYIDFCNESVVGLTLKYDNLLVVQTFSKGYSLAGIRCGYAIGNSKLIEGLNIVKDCFNNYPIDYITEQIAIEAVLDEQYYRDINAKVVLTRERVIGAMRKMGFNVLNSSSNFIFASHNSYPAVEIYKKLKEKKILVRHWNKEKISNYLRISVGTDAEMDLLLENMSKILNAK